MNAIPHDVLRIIIGFSDTMSILRISATCKRWREVAISMFGDMKKWAATLICSYCHIDEGIIPPKYCSDCWTFVCIICNRNANIDHYIVQHHELNDYISLCHAHGYYICSKCKKAPKSIGFMIMKEGSLQCMKCASGFTEIQFIGEDEREYIPRITYPPQN